MQIRKAALSDAAAIAKVHIDSWKTTYRGIVPDAYLDTMSYEDRKKRWEANLKADQHVFVAENEEGAIVGFASGGKEIMKQTIEIGGARLTEISYGWEYFAIGTKPQE